MPESQRHAVRTRSGRHRSLLGYSSNCRRGGLPQWNTDNRPACYRFLRCRANGLVSLSLLPVRPRSSRFMHHF
jgi:hypothetical protein